MSIAVTFFLKRCGDREKWEMGEYAPVRGEFCLLRKKRKFNRLRRPFFRDEFGLFCAISFFGDI